MRKSTKKRELSPRGAQFPFKKMENMLFFNNEGSIGKGLFIAKMVAFKHNVILINVNNVPQLQLSQ